MSTNPEGRIAIRRALVSVYDKTGLEDLARGLHKAGVSIVSTGGSAALIEALAIPVTRVEELTGFPECLDGRVKTLHPKVHAGILADRRLDSHVEQLAELGVEPFDLVISNLYPFSQTVASGASPDECVEQIDIGGPSMVRAAAKNHPSVAIVTSPEDYAGTLAAVEAGGYTLAERRRLATDAFVHTATYDVNVASWMGSVLVSDDVETQFPAWIGASWSREDVLRYGENPHQAAAIYRNGHGAARGLAQGTQLHGKEMSYNNYIDADAAYRAAYDHGDQPTVAIIKHANPCGIAVGADVAEAHRKAHECDPVSAYGGIIATNRPVTAEMAETVKDIFTEVIVAPGFEGAALDILTAKKNLRLLVVDPPTGLHLESRPITGGLLVQQRDLIDAAGTDAEGRPFGDDPAHWRLVAGSAVTDEVLGDLTFAWRSVRAVKSNAILLAKGGASVGVGMGQVNRVDSCNLAVTRAGDRAQGAVASSDAFFPFADGLQVLIDGGVQAVVAPGGSIRDDEVIAAANAAGISLYFTGTRHFAH
ncbi:bifunctional phosphoribosylaminoimidazolecarboxamide formyltransferase/IMP cyclohydrolase [Nocardioides sp. Bht2]|uniref:bifunctional phosphoribosylaminoimidazolecarboxamide formyltransferase/IMP cyclohydrolase n=1 Tax=Nocardioides sp. Bht2 TaxID=3392297 RepID=UPI0039B5580F